MLKRITYMLLCAMFLFLLCSCGANEDKSENLVNTEYYNRDEKAIWEHFVALQKECVDIEDNVEFDDTEAFVVHVGYVSGLEYWNAFMQNVEKGKKSSIDIVCFDRDANPMFHYLEYSGKDFFHCSYDTLENCMESGVYSYMNHIEVPKEDFDIGDGETLSFPEDVKKFQIALLNQKISTYEEYEKYMEKYYSGKISEEDFGWEFRYWTSDREFYEIIKGIIISRNSE